MIDEKLANSLIGKPYDHYTSHCWQLVEELVEGAPKISGVASSVTASVRQFKDHAEAHYDTMKEVTTYQDGDVIMLGRGDTLFHAGVSYRGGVIHASPNGVVLDSMRRIKLLYPTIKGLRCR